LIKNISLLFLGPQRTSKLQEKPSALKNKHPTLQNMKFLDFFLMIFALLDPDPAEPKSVRKNTAEGGTWYLFLYHIQAASV
jgi:hypothetical protein